MSFHEFLPVLSLLHIVYTEIGVQFFLPNLAPVRMAAVRQRTSGRHIAVATVQWRCRTKAVRQLLWAATCPSVRVLWIRVSGPRLGFRGLGFLLCVRSIF